jgi:hypothetical protein
MFMNIEGLPTKWWYRKTRNLIAWMEKHKLDTMLMAEINIFWASIPAEHQWSKRLDRKLRQGKRLPLHITVETLAFRSNNNLEVLQ